MRRLQLHRHLVPEPRTDDDALNARRWPDCIWLLATLLATEPDLEAQAGDEAEVAEAPAESESEAEPADGGEDPDRGSSGGE